MTDAAVAVAQGNGLGTELQMLISMMGRLGEMTATLKSVDAGLTEVRQNTSQQLALLQERIGRSEALNEVQNEQIKQMQQSDTTLRADIAALKAEHAKQIAELEVKHEKEMQALREEMRAEAREGSRMRWMIRGGIAVVAVVWPVVWNLVVLPMLGR
jgi:hypothetical protein